MQMTVKDIADLLGGEVLGDEAVVITGIASMQEAEKGELTFLTNPRYRRLFSETKASAIITLRDVTCCGKTLIRVDDPSSALVKLVDKFYPSRIVHPEGKHSTAIIAKSATIGSGVSIGAYTVIEEDVTIGDNTKIYPGCYVGRGVKIGKDSLLYANISIREGAILGNRVLIQSGSVIGSDGFGFITKDQKHKRIPQIGIVEIEDDVEIGANVAIDRARLGRTVIGKGTKIDNLVHIAHNVKIGKNCLIIAQVGMSGSSAIGNNVIMAGKSGTVGHVSVGDNTIVAGKSGVTKDIPKNSCVWGFPARPLSIAKRVDVYTQKLPDIYNTVKELKKKVEQLEDHGKTKNNRKAD